MAKAVDLEATQLIKTQIEQLWQHALAGITARGAEVNPEIKEAKSHLDGFLSDLEAELAKQQTDLLQEHRRMAALAAIPFIERDTTATLQNIVEVASNLLPASAGASIVLWDALTDTFSFGASTVPGITPEVAENILETFAQKGSIRWIVDHQKPLLLPDTKQVSVGSYPSQLERQFGAYIAVPLALNTEVLGVLYALDNEARHYSQGDLDFMMVLANRAASAIYRARLFETTRQTLAASQALYYVSRNLTATTDKTRLLQAVVDSVAEALGADRSLLLVLDVEKRQILEFNKGGPGKERMEVEKRGFENYWQGLTGWVLREGKSALSPGSRPDPREGVEAQQRRAEGESGAIIVTPLRLEEQLLGTLTVVRKKGQKDFNDDDLRLAEIMASQAAIAIKNNQLYEEVNQLATVDALTGCHNRRHLLELGEQEVKRHLRTKRPLAAIMLDLDHFKRINDHYGHAVGDEALQTLVKRCREGIREIDIFGRYGGEEFVLLLPETSAREALEVAERLRQAVAAEAVSTGGGCLPLTISLGVAELKQETDLAALLDRADAALYAAKQAGRNRVMGQVIAKPEHL